MITALTEAEMVGNGLLFFIAGYDTTATTLSFLLYFLAIHPDIQDRLRQEVHDVTNNQVTYYSHNSFMGLIFLPVLSILF